MTQTQEQPSGQGQAAPQPPRIAPIMPFGYLAGLVRWLGKAGDCKVISYSDMTLTPAMDQAGLDAEFGAWHQAHLKDKLRHILLQYDVDARADATMDLLKVHIEEGVPACAMVFNERIFDRVLREDGKIVQDENYRLDYGLLREFQSAGGQVGYHCNTWERGMFDLAKAKELFKRDVEALRKEVDIKYFSMHGGPLDPKGRSNAHMDVDDIAAELGVIWVHNGRSPSFHRNWDDGGAGRHTYRVRNGDVGEAIGLCRRGERLRCLFHPQYYWANEPSEMRHEYQGHLSWFNGMKEGFAVAGTGQSRRLFGWLGRRAKRDDSADRSKQGWFADVYWKDKADKDKQAPVDVEQGLRALSEDTGPVFINGMSRSGTTLLAGLFDVREDVAMSYELYPNYLVGHGEQADHYVDFSQVAFLLRNAGENEAFNLLAEMGEPKVSSFVACAGHSDLTTKDVGDALFWFLRSPSNVYTYQDALRFCSLCAHIKRVRVKKQNWGMKIQTAFDRYHVLWPKARHIYIMRDGRDILASQLNTGSFNPDPAQLGKNWTARAVNFERFLDRSGATGAIVKYEDLAREPEQTLRTLCGQLGLSFSDQMLSHHEHDISLLHKPRGQLSAARVAKPIDESAIGRWRQDLSKDRLQAFMETAGEATERWGYVSSGDTTS